MFSFKTAVAAQEFLIQQKNSRQYHIDFENGLYTITKSNLPPSDKVISIEEIEYDEDDYVYDIETEDGTFQAGVGCLIVKNTDSIYTQFTLPNQDQLSEEEKLKQIYDISIECAKRISDTFKKPIELEMENLKYPLVLFSKKRYIYRCLEKNKNGVIVDQGVEVKGFQTVRRDNCKLVKKICEPVIDKIIYDRNIEEAKRLAKQYITDLLDNKVNIYDLVITRSLKAEYKSTNKLGNKLSPPAHYFLAQKIKEREPGTEPKPGSRVPYIFIENEDKNALQQDRVEDPDYAIAHPKECRPDVLYYLDKQIASPLETLFSVLVRRPDGSIFPLDKNGKISKECKREIEKQIWLEAKRNKENKNKKQSTLKSFFAIKNVEELSDIDSDDEIIE